MKPEYEALKSLALIRDVLRAEDKRTANMLVEEFNKIAVALGAGPDWMIRIRV